MANYQLFPAKVVTPDGVLFDGEVQELEVPSVSGGLGILARRSPIVADLKRGQVRALLEDGTWKSWASQHGFAQASNSTATVVVEDAVEVSTIDPEMAQELISKSEDRLKAAEADKNDSEITAAKEAKAWGEHLLALHANN